MKRTGMARSSAILALLLLAAAGAQGQEMRAGAEETRGIWVGPVNLSPFFNLSGFYDSNVDFVREGEAEALGLESDQRDTFGYSLQPGLTLRLPGNGWGLEGRGWYQLEEYQEEFAEHRQDWAENLEFFSKTDRGFALRISEMLQSVSHEDLDMDRWNDRVEFRLGVDVGGPVTKKTGLLLSGFYNELDYEDRDLYDWDRGGGAIECSRWLTAKSDLLLRVGASTLGSEEQEGNAEAVTAMAGFASRATQRVQYRATAGVEFYNDFDGQKVFDADGYPTGETLGGDNDESGLAYSLAADWQITERLSGRLSGLSQFQPAEDVEDNSMQVSTLGAGLAYHPYRRWTLTADGLYRREDYTKPVRGDPLRPVSSDDESVPGQDREDSQYTALGRIVYALTRDVSVFGSGSYTYSTSSIEAYDYERWRAGVGLSARY